MRIAIIASIAGVFTVASGGCGGAAHVDNTPNRGTTGGGGGVNYPAGPYGYAKGSIIQNIQLQGKEDPGGATGTAQYVNLPMQAISLADFHNDPKVDYLVLNGSAGWCQPCREEAQEMSRTLAAKWEPMGVRFVSALIQGFDEANQTPSTAGDIDKWQAITKEHIYIGIDPNDYLHQFASQIASFPLNIIVRTYDMAILFQQIGLDSTDPSLDPILQQYVQ
jgi:hypothetical protein